MPRSCYRILIVSTWLALSVQASPLLDEMSAQFKRDFGIQIIAEGEPYPVGGAEGTILAQNTGVNNGDMVLSFLRKEFAKYPVELIRQSGVKRIVLCRELRIGSTRIAGVAVERNASIYVDSTTMVGDEPFSTSSFTFLMTRAGVTSATIPRGRRQLHRELPMARRRRRKSQGSTAGRRIRLRASFPTIR